MRACLVLCVAAALVGVARAECNACLDGLCYQKHRLAEISGILRDIDRNTNTLYVRADKTTEVIKKCALETSTCTNITFITDVTVDQRTGNVYGLDIRGTIFLYRDHRKYRTGIGSEATYLAFKDDLYLSPVNGLGIRNLVIVTINPHFTFSSKYVPGTEAHKTRYFIIDRHNDMYFEDATDYRTVVIRRLSGGVVNQTEAWDSAYRITVDKEGNAVFIHPDTRAVYRVTNGQMIDIGAVDDTIYGRPAFDSDNNLIYQTNLNEFYHLKRESNLQCMISTTAQNKRKIYYHIPSK